MVKKKKTSNNVKSVAVPTKQWWKSKTILFNIVLFAIAIIELLKGTMWVPIEILTFVGGLGNVVLRIWFSDVVLK